MAYINPRLRNPAEGADAAQATSKPNNGIFEILAGVGALVSFALAAATLAILYFDWDVFTKFIGR